MIKAMNHRQDIHSSARDRYINEIIDKFKTCVGFTDLRESLDYEIKERTDGDYLIFYVTHPTERFYRILNDLLVEISEENIFREKTTIQKRTKLLRDRIQIPETQLLRKELIESMTIDQHKANEDFVDRYIKTVFQAEDQIVTSANHIVYGRRGAGKSSLLVYFMYQLLSEKKPYAWISMQTYSQRTDEGLINDILIELLEQLKEFSQDKERIFSLQEKIESLKEMNNPKKRNDRTNFAIYKKNSLGDR